MRADARLRVATVVFAACLSGCGVLLGVDFDDAAPAPGPTVLPGEAANPAEPDPTASGTTPTPPPPNTDAEDASRRDPPPGACDPGGTGRLLTCTRGCAASLFDEAMLVDDFGPASAYAKTFLPGDFDPKPALVPGGLQFGPHDVTQPWWNNYSPTRTVRTDFGDVLVCIRLRVNAVSTTGKNALQVSLRGGSEGMVLGFSATEGSVSLTSKLTTGQDDWQEHMKLPHPFDPGVHDLEMALYGQGSDFWAEIADAQAKSVHALSASWTLPATGPVELLGFQLPQPLVVSRIAIGRPTPAVAARIRQKP